MKRLYLVRHAKSSWKDLSIDDIKRPLNKRGKRTAPLIADSFKRRNIKPDIIISSPALRAKDTVKALSDNMELPESISYSEDLYDCVYIQMNKLSKCLKEDQDEAVLVGHNPEITVFACNFIDFDKNIPTAGVVGIEFDCEKWSDADFTNAKLMFFDHPKKNKLKKM